MGYKKNRTKVQLAAHVFIALSYLLRVEFGFRV